MENEGGDYGGEKRQWLPTKGVCKCVMVEGRMKGREKRKVDEEDGWFIYPFREV